MSKYLTSNHEEILMFLEDNISKLVKLNVASRAKYREYDENYFDYLTADSIDDEERKCLYSELTEQSYAWLKNKLQKAILKNPGLAENPIVKEYAQLMLGELDSLPDPEYIELLRGEDSYRLADFVCFFSNNLTEDEEECLEQKSEEELLAMIEDRLYNHVEEWIDDLPHNDLKVLRELVDKGRITAPVTCLQLLIEQIMLIDHSLAFEEDEDAEFIIYDDIKQTVTPYLDAAIERKEENNEGFLETLFLGIVNIVGRIEEAKAREVMKELLPQTGHELTSENVDRFFDHSMLVKYHRGSYVCQPDGDLYSQIEDGFDWEGEIRGSVKPFYPTDYMDVLAHGEYPYFKPYRMEERTFYSFLTDCLKYTNESALSIITDYYCHLQNPDYNIKEMIRELIFDVRFHDAKQKKFAIDIIILFCNGIPKFILKGNTAKQLS
ncbi:MAG: hypothetical protein ACI4T5_09145 [Prevotella sp.]